MANNHKSISNNELDRIFDEGQEDILQYFDTANARRPGLEARVITVNLAVPVFEAVERESLRTGSSVQDLIESWVEEKVRWAA